MMRSQASYPPERTQMPAETRFQRLDPIHPVIAVEDVDPARIGWAGGVGVDAREEPGGGESGAV
jgi:hypothetical protein